MFKRSNKMSDQVTEVAAPEDVQPPRGYHKIPTGEFIKIANASNTIWEIVDKTGMSYAGTRSKLKKLKAGNVALKRCLFERQKRTKREVAA